MAGVARRVGDTERRASLMAIARAQKISPSLKARIVEILSWPKNMLGSDETRERLLIEERLMNPECPVCWMNVSYFEAVGVDFELKYQIGYEGSDLRCPHCEVKLDIILREPIETLPLVRAGGWSWRRKS